MEDEQEQSPPETRTPNDKILDELVSPTKLVIRKSIHNGYGVFALDDIKKEEILEESVFSRIQYRTKDLVYNDLKQICYTYPCNCDNCKYRGRNFLLSCGYIQVYNHSEDQDVMFQYLLGERIIRVVAIKDIPKGKEIYHNYGKAYNIFSPISI